MVLDAEELDGEGAVRSFSEVPLRLPGWAIEAVRESPWEPLRDVVIERCLGVVFPAQRSDRTFLESLTQSVDENVRALRDVLTGGLAIHDIPMEYRLRFTSLEAQARVTQASMQRSYRLSFFLQWQRWSEVVAAVAVRGDVGTAAAGLAQRSVSAIVQAYGDAVVSRLSLSFARSEDALNRSRTHIRHRLVRELLGGDGGALSPADLVTLDYPLDAWHLAVRLTNVPIGAAERIATGLRSSVHQHNTLVYPASLDTSIIWLGSGMRWSDGRIQRVEEALRTSGVTGSISDTAPGLAGFLRVFEQARQVDTIRSAGPETPGTPVMRYDAVRLEILLLQDPDLASDFITQELGPLAEDTAEAAKLRSTVDASFRLGSHVATAEHLRLHEHTVRNRLQRAQELLGPLHERRTEIQVALRLWPLVRKR